MNIRFCLNQAKKLAHEIHSQDRRIISGIPYINHPQAVAHMLARLRFSGVLIATGWLHDGPEDHPESWPFEEIEDGLSRRGVDERFVAGVVENLRVVTYDHTYASRRERCEHYREALVANPRVIPVVLADKLDNLDDILTNLRFRRNVFGANYLNCNPRDEIKNWLAVASICYERGSADRRVKNMTDELIKRTETVRQILFL